MTTFCILDIHLGTGFNEEFCTLKRRTMNGPLAIMSLGIHLGTCFEKKLHNFNMPVLGSLLKRLNPESMLGIDLGPCR
ncbi:MAG: hypothetical protein RL095_461 [Verrucomicrobiota bacterium]